MEQDLIPELNLPDLDLEIPVTEQWLIGHKARCIICGGKQKLKEKTNWVIDYENFYQDNYRPRHFCNICKAFSAYCLKCDKFTETSKLEGWFYDYLYFKDAECDEKVPAHLCPECRIETGEGSVKCERCNKLGEYGEGKWNENEGHIDCDRCEMIICYECHDLVHYNK